MAPKIRRLLRRYLAEEMLYSLEEFDFRQAEGVEQVEGVDGLRDCSEVLESFALLTKLGHPFIQAARVRGDGITCVRHKAFEVALMTETTGLVILASESLGIIELWRRRFDTQNFDSLKVLEPYLFGGIGGDGGQLCLLEEDMRHNKTRAGIGIPIDCRLEGLFFDIHSSMRDIDGLHADSALDELCKLLYLKAFIEEQRSILANVPLRTSGFGSFEECAASLRGIYRAAVDYDLRVFRLKIPQYERSRGVFSDPIRLSSHCLVKCYRLIQEYSLLQSSADIKGRAFQRVLGKAVRQGMGQYFTPVQVAEMMVRIMQPSTKDLILDPFCGSGHFLSLSLACIRDQKSVLDKEFHEFAFGKLHGIEKSERMTRVAMTDMRLGGDGHSNIRCTDALLEFSNYPDIHEASFDIVMTNPPFGSLLGAETIKTLGRFSLAEGRKAAPMELLGLERSVQFLRPGGRLAIVLPDSIFTSDSFRFARTWIVRNLRVRGIISLPPHAFSPFGANVKTNILFARKLNNRESANCPGKVFMIQVDNPGYDAAGREVTGSDLNHAVAAALMFLKNEGW